MSVGLSLATRMRCTMVPRRLLGYAQLVIQFHARQPLQVHRVEVDGDAPLDSGMLDPCIRVSVLTLNILRHSRQRKGCGLRVSQNGLLIFATHTPSLVDEPPLGIERLGGIEERDATSVSSS